VVLELVLGHSYDSLVNVGFQVLHASVSVHCGSIVFSGHVTSTHG
jgi:hypothetical protein